MQYAIVLSAVAALSSAAILPRQDSVQGVNFTPFPEPGCAGSNPTSAVPASFFDDHCHSFGADAKSVQATLSRTDVKQNLILYSDVACGTMVTNLSNEAGQKEGTILVNGTCVSAPPNKIYKAMTYTTAPPGGS